MRTDSKTKSEFRAATAPTTEPKGWYDELGFATLANPKFAATVATFVAENAWWLFRQPLAEAARATAYIRWPMRVNPLTYELE